MARKPIVNLVDSFKLFTSKFNILSNNVGDMEQLTTYQDSDLVTVINEIEAAFDASSGEILYPNGQDGETQTRLKISTNQSSGTDIDIDAGQDFLVDAVRNIELTSVSFDGDYSGNYTSKTDGNVVDSAGGSRTITTTGNHNIDTLGALVVNATGGHIDLNASNNIILDAGADVILDAGDSDLFFRRNGTVFVKTQMGVSGDATLTRQYYQQGGLELDAAGNISLDASGDIILDAEANDIIFKNGDGADQVIHNINNNGNYSINAPANMYLNTVGDIVLNADGNDVIFRNNEGGSEDSARITLENEGDILFSVLGHLTFVVERDIVLDAKGDNITLKDGGTTRQQYTLGATTTIETTGNRTETVTGNVSDSAAGTYHIGATGNMDIDTRGTLDVVTGGNATLDTTGDVLVKASGDITLDAEDDIILDANGADIVMKDGGSNKFTFNFGTNQELDVTGNFTVDATGDIILDAGDSDIIFKRNGTTFATHRLGVNGDPTQTRVEYTQGPLFLDVSGDIIMEADGGDVYLKDDGTEFLRFTHAGNGNAGINNNNIRVITFEDSDAVFENDVNIEGDLDVDLTLNVDGDTTLNGHVDLGSNGDDNISVLGKFDTNLRPDATNSYTLGTSTLKWRHAYLEQTLFAKNIDVDSADIGNLNFNSNTMSGTSDIVLDAASDIILDAGDSDVIFKRNGTTIGKAKMGIAGQPSTFALASTGGNFNIDAYGDIVLDAGDSDIIFKRNGTTFLRHRMGVSGADLFTRMEYAQGGVEIDAAGDITLDASGNDIKLKDDGNEFGRFSHIGSNQLGIYSNGENLALSFSDSDAVFNNDVNIEGDLDVDLTLNVDGNTTLNANVTLGNAATDQISATGQFVTSLVPLTDDDYSIGAVSKEWKHGYFDGTVFADNLDGDSATIANFNFNGNTAKSSAGLILDAANDITLNARGEDIIFKTADSAGITWNLGRSDPTLVYSSIHDRSLVLNVDRNIYLDAGDGIVQFRDSANSLRMQVAYTTATGTEIDVTNGSLTFDVSGDFVFDANGGDVLLKDNNVQYGRFQNNANNLRIWSADSVAATFTGKNVAFNGTVTLPSADLDKTTKTVHGCINELDSDLGTRTSLSSFYDGHNQDVITALNRVAARIVDVYDENGTLLNN